MKLRYSMALVLVAAGCLAWQASSGADEKKTTDKKPEPAKDVIVNGELTNADLKDKVLTESFCKTYTFKMIEGRTYQIDLKSRAFDAFLRLENPKGDQVVADDDSGGMLDSRINYRAPTTGDYTICAMSLGGGSTGKFMLIVKDLNIEVKPIVLKAEKGQAAYTGNIANTDQRHNNKLHKQFKITLEEGNTYQIDQVSGAFDAYLYLIGPDGNVLAEDDDGGEGLNSRIVHKAGKAGAYQIIATSLSGQNTGQFTLTVKQTNPK
ncbi:MAG: hypothetical protein EXR98_07515 [Gemmataceae bacterium]|nr:hypothetical protein [Gemmataceae bacterium]